LSEATAAKIGRFKGDARRRTIPFEENPKRFADHFLSILTELKGRT